MHEKPFGNPVLKNPKPSKIAQLRKVGTNCISLAGMEVTRRLPETDRPTDRAHDATTCKKCQATLARSCSRSSVAIAAFESWRSDFRRNGIEAYKRNQAQTRRETV